MAAIEGVKSMSNKRLHWLQVGAIALLVVGIGVAVFSGASAQTGTPTPTGIAVIGNVSANGAQVAYSLDGNAGDLLIARVFGTSAGMDPTLSLLGPMQEPLASNDNASAFPFTTSSQLIYRLPVTGTYTLVVSGTAGDYVLTVDVTPSVVAIPLVFNTPVAITIPAQSTPQVYSFNTDPFNATTLLIDAQPFDMDAYVDVSGGDGRTVTLLRGNLDNACVSLSPGDELHEITVSSGPDDTGTVTLTLSNAPCVLGPEPAPIVAATPIFQPIPIAGVCAASSRNNVNMRSGPGLNYGVILILPRFQPVQVIGVSQDGRWYGVQTQFGVQGWIAASVVSIVGPCTGLPAVQAPQPPAASPTPGIPLITVTPAVTVVTATPGPATQTPAVTIVTATTAPGQPSATTAPTTVPPTTAPTTAATVAATATTPPVQGPTTAATMAATATMTMTPTATATAG
jgi:hypothetical protein